MKKRLILLFLAIAFMLTLLPNIVLSVSAETIASGISEEGFRWELDSEGTLMISGEGAMKDYSPAGGGYMSWIDANMGYSYNDQIKKIILSHGITNIGNAAFDYCRNLISVEIPDTVLTIGDYAFLCCFNLEFVIIPDSVTAIGMIAFQGCEKLTNIIIPRNVVGIEDGAFAGCDELRCITFVGDAPVFGDGEYMPVFEDVKATVYYPHGNPTWTADVMQNYGGILTWIAEESSDRDFVGSFNEFMEQKAYQPYWMDAVSEYTPPTQYAFIDINKDGNQELIICSDNDFGFYLFSVFEYHRDTNKVTPLPIPAPGYEIHSCYGGLEYSDLYTAIVFTETNDGSAFGGLTYYSMNEGKMSSCFHIGYKNYDGNGAKYYTSEEENISEEKYFEYIFESGAIEFSPIVDFVPREDAKSENGLVIYSDYTNLSIRKGSTITLSAGILTDGEVTGDVSGITFQIEDTSILGVSTTDVKENCRYVKLKGLVEGTATVVFNDSTTGYTAKVLVTVYDDNYLSYTLNSVPTQNIEKYPTNVYNVNGIYIDSYKYTVNDDQSATVSFDVYNTNYTYGVVEVFDENGNMKDAVLIEKMTSSNTSIKTAVWDNIGYLVRDIIDGDLLSYRQESGYTKKTSVSVKIPQNGYIKICTDPENSLIVGLINSVDGLMSMASLAGDIKDFDVNSQEFSKKLTMKLLTDQVYVELIKDGSDAPKDLWKNVGKETFITSESMGSFTDTITKNIDELKLGSVIADTAMDFGWDVGENVFTYFAGPAGTALNVMFTIGKVENLIIQQNDLIQSAGVGSIYIQNQGGGLRACQQIKVDSEEGFADDTALNVFSVTLESDVLDIIEKYNPDIYEQIVNGVTYTYNISLMKDGSETQPNGEVTVYIPIPDELKALAYAGDLVDGIPVKVKIYRIEEDGALTEMDIRIEDGCFVFITDHFSLYTIVGCDSGDDTTPSQDENGLPTIMIIGIVTIVTVGVGAAVIIKRKKK